MSQFNALATTELRSGDLEVRATVIGASHVLSIFLDGSELFHEILACVKPMEASGNVVLTRPLNRLSSRNCETILCGTRYRFGFRSLIWGNLAVEVVNDFRAAVKRADEWQSAYFEFPQGNLSHTPATIVLLRETADGKMHVTSAHSYPDQALVISNTAITTEQ